MLPRCKDKRTQKLTWHKVNVMTFQLFPHFLRRITLRDPGGARCGQPLASLGFHVEWQPLALRGQVSLTTSQPHRADKNKKQKNYSQNRCKCHPTPGFWLLSRPASGRRSSCQEAPVTQQKTASINSPRLTLMMAAALTGHTGMEVTTNNATKRPGEATRAGIVSAAFRLLF